ncbi:hypothetical protein EGY25_04475 [Brevundimonas intermedia]|uniref:Uncharacterized protein n=1 Tax=Brevundimonas intermedia TaxID=74315 RepID=A0A4Y9RZW4_9CAUL|nr:hypothetical protein [Brevundimonas intermedia]TFW14453.1 hypothetical protein EGY25_04475 [Brevundimonas intermedia]
MTTTSTPEFRPISTAARNGTMLRLWVRYPKDGSWTPLEDARESWTIGFNNSDNTEEDRWQVVGWSWSHDLLVEASTDVEVLGWLPFHGEQYHATQIAEVIDEGDGFWKPCSGCQEGEDGHVSAKDYPFNSIFRCQPGGGCSECGGLGVLWDDTDYDAMTKAIVADMDSEDDSAARLDRAHRSLRALQEGAALAMPSFEGNETVYDFLCAIHREAVKGLLASDDVTNEGGLSVAPCAKAPEGAGQGFADKVAIRDAAVAYRARIACDILEGFTDGIDGDRLGELARWVTRGRALDDAALHRAFAAPWIAASEEAGWEGDADAEARKDIDRHTITARVRGVTSFTPDQLATIFARHNELKATAANALEVANSHIQHMAGWISKTNASDTPLHGYSFEALGEDKWIIDQAIAALKATAPQAAS